ncbi:FAD-dependent oxidoreductase [Amycolatopsis bartoniae]|nr:FAD-dependent oxidoreductase [Amycolatopsis bartoniae]
MVPSTDRREFRVEDLDADLVVVGGGMAGTCCAITAARAGARVILAQDRPVLGGNASSEVRLWVQSANAHMNVNNRWAREGGVIDEILVENTYRNPDGNVVLFDAVLLDKVSAEPNIKLLLNTSLINSEKEGDRISFVLGFNSQNQTIYKLSAPLFCDASGDGALGYLAGASFRVGAESNQEFDEGFAPSEEYGELLPNSLFFYSKNAGHPVKFTPPNFARLDIAETSQYRNFKTDEYGAMLWWLDHGGRLDTINDAEQIKWELWKIVYGIWDHLKNSGKYPDAENLTLEWIGTIAGKRESRRFEGHYMLHQKDIIEQARHGDAVAFGGWAIDLHPADGIFSEYPAANLLWPRGIYQIPYRCLLSRSVPNLFLGGRLISATHVAFGSTRVMATCAHMGQAVGMAAALCARDELDPIALLESGRMRELRRQLLRTGQHIPGVPLEDPENLVQEAEVHTSSEFVLTELPPDGPSVPLSTSRAQLIPLPPGRLPQVTFIVDVAAPTTLHFEARTGRTPDDYTPDMVLDVQQFELNVGDGQHLKIDINANLTEERYVFFCFMRNKYVAVRTSEQRLTGLVSVRHRDTQERDDVIGRPRIEFWSPERRPHGQNLAISIEPPIHPFGRENVRNGFARPTASPNAWVADPQDSEPELLLLWSATKKIGKLVLAFDTDFDHAMESVITRHHEAAMPFCVSDYIVRAGSRVIVEQCNNHQTRNVHIFNPPVETSELTIQLLGSHGDTPLAIFELLCYEK